MIDEAESFSPEEPDRETMDDEEYEEAISQMVAEAEDVIEEFNSVEA